MKDSQKDVWSLPASSTFLINDTPESGRAVVAKTDAENGCHLLTTTEGISPLAHVLLRPYRREVCAWCFAYDRGREWKIRQPLATAAFCSTKCEETWLRDNDEICVQSMKVVEDNIKTQSRRSYQQPLVTDGVCVTSNDVNSSWTNAEKLAANVIAARATSNSSKAQRAAQRQAADNLVDADILTYVFAGVIAAYKSAKKLQEISGESVSALQAHRLLPALYQLMPDDQVFTSNPMTASPLQDYIAAYLVLLAILPLQVTYYISTDLVINLASRAAHNAFSIRPEGLTDGEQSGEFLGWGVWPEASFFNHSCRPNVRKERVGRMWSFYVDDNHGDGVKRGQQLCITYLGGDERDLDTTERRKRLQEQWGFFCRCARCEANT